MDPSEHFKGSNAQIRPKDCITTPWVNDAWKKMGCNEKKASIHKEMKRLSKLPSNSTYAINRLRILNKMLQFLSIQRTTTQEEELDLLFARLSL
ncbi:hypothetical protein U1Q18_046693 [Sarracenia purpurea var. burkii]